MKTKTAAVLFLLCLVSAGVAQVAQVQLSGTVRNRAGTPLAAALVRLLGDGSDLHAITNSVGFYNISGSVIGVLPRTVAFGGNGLSFHNGAVRFVLSSPGNVSVELFNVQGKRLSRPFAGRLPEGEHQFDMRGHAASTQVMLVRVRVDAHEYTLTYMPGRGMVSGNRLSRNSANVTASLAKASAAVDTMRASAAGYIASSAIIAAYTGVVDFVLDSLDQASTTSGTSGHVDGSYDRFAAYGVEQYFWGDPGTGTEIPLVQVVSAVSEEVVDVMMTFNPAFTDNTYGTGSIGWGGGSRGRPFDKLVGSDHIEIKLTNGLGEVVLHVKIDLISSCPDAVSGYCSQGVLGEDGAVYVGSASSIISFGTSIDENLNYWGCDSFLVNSPATDAQFTPPPECPNWQYYASYRISVDPSIFGPSGYGGSVMNSVHASPAKTPSETIIVHEGPSPDPETSGDPWQYFNPYINPTPTEPSDTIPITD